MLPIASTNIHLVTGNIGNWQHFHTGNIFPRALGGDLYNMRVKGKAE
jgi:hypothetical protein